MKTFATRLISGHFHDVDDELGAQPTFTGRRLLDACASATHELALPGVLGDAVLLARLPLFANMRRALLAHGYRFVDLRERPHKNRIAPDLTLLPTLRSRTISFRPTRLGLEEWVAEVPLGAFDDYAFFRTFGFNNTTHEGSHALVYEAALADQPTLDDEKLVETLIAGEGFAMGFELTMALQALAETSRTTPLFLSLNSSASPFLFANLGRSHEGLLPKLAALACEKPAAVIRLYGEAGIVANVRPAAKSAKAGFVELLIERAGLAAHRAEAQVLVQLALELDPDFRELVSPTFFRFHGLFDAYRAVCARPLEVVLDERAVFSRTLPTCLREVLGSDADEPRARHRQEAGAERVA